MFSVEIQNFGTQRNVQFFYLTSIFIGKIEPMDVRLQHTDIFHNKRLGLQVHNEFHIFFYKAIVLIDNMTILAIRIGESLTGRPPDNYIKFPVVSLKFVIIRNVANVPKNLSTFVIPLICFPCVTVVLHRNRNLTLLSLQKPKAQSTRPRK